MRQAPLLYLAMHWRQLAELSVVLLLARVLPLLRRRVPGWPPGVSPEHVNTALCFALLAWELRGGPTT